MLNRIARRIFAKFQVGLPRPPARSPARPAGYFAAFAVAGLALFSPARAQNSAVSPPAAILAVMQRVADWQLAHPSAHPPTDWTNAAGDAGLMALAGISGEVRFREALVAMGAANSWQPGPRIYHADDHCIGQTYVELFLRDRDPAMIAPLRARFDSVLASPAVLPNLDFTQPGAGDDWSWCDALFMGPPTWARLAAVTGDQRYLDFAVRHWWHTTDFLYDKDEHLFYRDSTYFGKREANGRKVFWSRGNGWVIAGLVRLLQFLPNNHPDRPRFEQLFRDLAAKILSCQQADGLWRSSLLDPRNYPSPETSGSGFHTYALAWGINQGLLDRALFAPAVGRAWTALTACVDGAGRLNHVQPIGADPKNFDTSSTEVYGSGAFLLAGSEIYRLALFTQRPPVVVRVTNPSDHRRNGETVELDLNHPRLAETSWAVLDGVSARVLDSQTHVTAPGHPTNKLLFQVDLAPGETRTFDLCPASALAALPPPLTKTFAGQMHERAGRPDHPLIISLVP